MNKRMLTGCIAFALFAQIASAQVRVTGRVISADDGQPIVGASVIVKGTKIGTVTNVDGSFTLNTKDAKMLRISYLGMAPVEVAAGENLKVTLKPDARALNEVVVTAMGLSREQKSLGYSLQEVSGDILTKAGQQDIGGALAGKVSGVQITQAGGALGASQRITIRGNSSFSGTSTNQPLIVVDGVPFFNDQGANDVRGNDNGSNSGGSVDLGSGLNDLNPDDIESISVLKGGSAALYGMRAGNGVILITTKSGKGRKKGVTVNYNMDITVDKVFHLPELQNKYGQGSMGHEYVYNTGSFKDSEGVTHTYKDYYKTYQDFATAVGYRYADGEGSGANDGDDESWGPRLDIGLEIPQYNSPVIDGVRQATPWVSHSNNIKDFFRTGFSQNHSVAISSVGDKATVRAALGYRHQEGTVPNTDLTKYTAQLNAKYTIGRYFDYDITLNYNHNKSGNLVTTGYTASNPMQSILEWFGRQVDMKDLKANWAQKDAAGNYTYYNWINAFHVNPYFNVYANPNKYSRDRIFGKSSLFFKPFSFLKFEGRIGYDMYTTNLNAQIYYDTDHPYGWFRNQRDTQRELNMDIVGYYNQQFDKLSVNAMFGANYRDNTYSMDAYGAQATSGLTVPGLFAAANIKGSPITKTDHSHVRSNSIYANVSLGWDNQFYLEGSLRNDWSSTLPKANRSFFYPSISASWIPTETFKWMQSDILNFLKLRGGVAKIGNATDAYMIGNYYRSETAAVGGVNQYSLPTTAPYENLKPEKVQTWEIGLEAGLFDNRLHIDATYYKKTTSDQIMNIQTPYSSGYNYALINAGKVVNKGVELQISGDIFKNPQGFSWTATLNWSKNKNKILELVEGLDTYTIGSQWSTYNYAKVGEPWGQLYGASFDYDDQGRVVVGADGLPLTKANQKIGDVNPKWLAGLRNEFSYKNLSFGFLLDYRKGGDFFSVTQMFGAQTGILKFTAEGDIRERGIIVGKDVLADKVVVKEDGTPNDIQVNAQDWFYSYYSNKQLDVLDGSFLKLRELHLTYAFPQSLLAKTRFIKAANISFIANNVAILWLSSKNQSKIDPESSLSTLNNSVGYESNSVPPTRSFGIKLGLTF